MQIEPVKLLPGAPLRLQVEEWDIKFDPNPPYTILNSKDLEFEDLERLRGIGELLDLLVNSGRFSFLMKKLTREFSRLSLLLEDLDAYWQEKNLYHHRRSLRELYFEIDHYLQNRFVGEKLAEYRELLGRDYAHHERVVSGSAPDFFNTDLEKQEIDAVRARVKQELDGLDRSGKIQYFAASFHHLPEYSGRTILIFLYVAKTSTGLQIKELTL